MQNGAELLVIPNACGLVPDQLRELRTRAVENAFDVAMANYASMHGRSVAFDHLGHEALAPAPAEVGVYLATFDISALRKFRASKVGQEKQAQPAQPGLCEIGRHPAFARQNVFSRVGGFAW